MAIIRPKLYSRTMTEMVDDDRIAAANETTIVFVYVLAYVDPHQPHGRGSGVSMSPDPVRHVLPAAIATLQAQPDEAARMLWRAETEFIAWVQDAWPKHALILWEARLGDREGPLLSEFRCGFTASE